MFITVATIRPETIPAYLYAGVTILAAATAPNYAPTRTVLVLHVASTDTRSGAFLAQDQADRLASGMHGARVFDTAAEAFAAIAGWLVPSRLMTAPAV